NSANKARNPFARAKDRTISNALDVPAEVTIVLNSLGVCAQVGNTGQDQVTLDDAQSVSDGESMITGHQIPSVLSPNEAHILSSRSSNASIPRVGGGTRTVSPASVGRTLPSQPLTQEPLQAIFPYNVTKPLFHKPLPKLRDRFSSTPQLAFCHHLLPKKPSSSPPLSRLVVLVGVIAQEMELNEAEHEWMDATGKDPVELDRFRCLSALVVSEFLKISHKDAGSIAEIAILGTVLERKDYRDVLSSLLVQFEREPLLDLDLLKGMVQLVQSASPGYLINDDLAWILRILRECLQHTYKAVGDSEQPASAHIYQLAIAISRVLDVMVETDMKGLSRTEEYNPLLSILAGLKDSSNPYLRFQASYAWQALQNIGDDESAWHAVLCFGGGLTLASLGATSTFKLDSDILINGIRDLGQVAGQPFDVTKSAMEGFKACREGSEGIVDNFKKKFQLGIRTWYPALQGARLFIREGHLAEFKRVVCETHFRREREFQWGVCQLLGEVALDPVWDIVTRQQAIDFLKALHRNEIGWKPRSDVKQWILTILTILTQLKEVSDQDIYIPPQAKASLQSQDDDLFPLESKVHEFLESEDAKVLLLLGDSGAGKSIFSQHLEHQLWKKYRQGGIIPLRLLLSAIDKPDQDLIQKYLESNDFTTDQIRELRQRRTFVLICDGYDESRQKCNLYHTNRLNRRGQWRCKVIITCRSQYLGHDYRMLFQPTSTANYLDAPPGSFEEAVIAPFSTDQIKDYVNQYVDLQHRQWTATEYMDKLTIILDLMDLVKNPFLLMLALQALPAIVGEKTDLSSIRVTRVILYDKFMDSWLESNKQRIQRHIQRRPKEEQEEFEAMLDNDFTQEGTAFLKKLSACVFEKQPGNPVIIYPAIIPKWKKGVDDATDDTWKEEFFGSSARIKLLREASPMTRSGKQFRLLHRSLLEYFYSLHFYDPCDFADMPQDDPPTFESLLLSIFTHSLSQRNIIDEPMVVQFLADRARVDPFFEQQLKFMIGRLTAEPGSSQAKKNAVTILVEAGIRYRGLDLKEMSVQQRLDLFGV
ncbi:hypothetical protein BGX33_000801, partial [Mortierella sp. NVP41]